MSLPGVCGLRGSSQGALPMREGPAESMLHTMHTTTNNTTTSARRFARHYGEMIIAMVAGMVFLGLPIEGILRLAGTSSDAVQDSAPAAMLLEMAIIMTIPMVAWMRRHGHAWRPCGEMSASMFVPTLAAIALMGAGAVGFGTAMVIEHVVMLPAMLGVMLLRYDEYAGDHRHHAHAHAPAVAVAAEA